MAGNDQRRLTKNERRQQAREQARIARERERAREKRNRLLWQGGIVVGVLAIVVVVGLVVMNSIKPAGPGPQNMASGGVVFGKDLTVQETPALENGEKRIERDEPFDQKPLRVEVFSDYMCPACGNFEAQYGDMLEQYVGAGDITLEAYPITFLDSQSAGSKYSSRASNALGCVVEQQPEKAYAFHTHLFEEGVQPAEGTTGLSDQELVDAAVEAGVEKTSEFTSCVRDKRFVPFFQGNTKQAIEQGVLGLAPDAQLIANPQTGELQPEGEPQRLVSTPLVLVNGYQWNSGTDGDLEAYILKQLQNLDAEETEDDTATADE